MSCYRILRSMLIFVVAGCVVHKCVDAQRYLPPLGVLEKKPEAFPGYTLLAPLSSHHTFLIDNDGKVVHSWKAEAKPGQAAYLLEDGSLLRAAKTDNFFQFPETTGSGGRIQKFDWEGNLIWDFDASSPYRMSHHDVEPLPNGNVLLIVWESYLREVAERKGRNPSRLNGDVLWFEAIFEIEPDGLHGGNIVWKWSLLDHVIQDFAPARENYGDPAKHPELVDINFAPRPTPDWVHMNSIDYNPELDQIIVGSRSLCEFWVIDHSTTTEEAAGHTGGRYGKGGDLLYRWGNPAVYRRGKMRDQMLFNQHDVQWVPQGCPGAGHVILFNNGEQNTVNDFSTADELTLPVDDEGSYSIQDGKPYGPKKLTWTFEDPHNLFSPRISGVQRLPNGNTLICSGTQSVIQEVTPEGKTVWLYRNPPRYRVPNASANRSEDRKETSAADRNPSGHSGSVGDNPDRHRSRREAKFPVPVSTLAKEEQDRIRIPGGIPLEEGGTLFRAVRYPLDYPAFRGRDLTPSSESKLTSE